MSDDILLSKYIAKTMFCSRKEENKLIEQDSVNINGELV